MGLKGLFCNCLIDPWRQKSREHTREQTPGNSLTVQSECKQQLRRVTDCNSQTDSGFISDSQLRIGRIPSMQEPLQNCQPIILEDEDYDEHVKGDFIPGRESFQCCDSEVLHVTSEKGKDDATGGTTI